MSFYPNVLLFDAVDGTSNHNSAAVSGEVLWCVSVQAVVTGNVTGTLKLQASNDPIGLKQSPTNWTDISGATVTLSSATSFLIPKLEICYQSIRAVFTSTGGSAGTVSAHLKGVGY